MHHSVDSAAVAQIGVGTQLCEALSQVYTRGARWKNDLEEELKGFSVQRAYGYDTEREALEQFMRYEHGARLYDDNSTLATRGVQILPSSYRSFPGVAATFHRMSAARFGGAPRPHSEGGSVLSRNTQQMAPMITASPRARSHPYTTGSLEGPSGPERSVRKKVGEIEYNGDTKIRWCVA